MDCDKAFYPVQPSERTLVASAAGAEWVEAAYKRGCRHRCELERDGSMKCGLWTCGVQGTAVDLGVTPECHKRRLQHHALCWRALWSGQGPRGAATVVRAKFARQCGLGTRHYSVHGSHCLAGCCAEHPTCACILRTSTPLLGSIQMVCKGGGVGCRHPDGGPMPTSYDPQLYSTHPACPRSPGGSAPEAVCASRAWASRAVGWGVPGWWWAEGEGNENGRFRLTVHAQPGRWNQASRQLATVLFCIQQSYARGRGIRRHAVRAIATGATAHRSEAHRLRGQRGGQVVLRPRHAQRLSGYVQSLGRGAEGRGEGARRV